MGKIYSSSNVHFLESNFLLSSILHNDVDEGYLNTRIIRWNWSFFRLFEVDLISPSIWIWRVYWFHIKSFFHFFIKIWWQFQFDITTLLHSTSFSLWHDYFLSHVSLSSSLNQTRFFHNTTFFHHLLPTKVETLHLVHFSLRFVCSWVSFLNVFHFLLLNIFFIFWLCVPFIWSNIEPYF